MSARPAAADRALDLLRGVVDAADAALAGGEQHDAARLADRERRADVLTEVQCFERDGVGPVLVEQVAQARVQRRQPALRGQPGGGGDDPAVGGDEPMATPNDDAEAAVGEAGIDAEDHHRTVILRGGPDASLRPGRPRCQGPDHVSTPSTLGYKATDDAVVLLWGDRHELRRALADARARLAGLEAQLADRARTDACTGLLTLEAFCGDAEAVLAHAARAEQPASLGARRHRRLPLAQRPPRPGGRRRRPARRRRAPARPHARVATSSGAPAPTSSPSSCPAPPVAARAPAASA